VKKLLVVDASVVRAAGDTEHEVSTACRSSLEAIRHICHRVAVTPEIRDEWDRHMSRFSRKWRRSMAARRKPLQPVTATDLVLDMAGLSENECVAIEKDRCLLEAAVSADRIIVTLDDALRSILAKTPQNAQLLASITWVNPVKDGAEALERLQA
jgi:hypothetical protein